MAKKNKSTGMMVELAEEAAEKELRNYRRRDIQKVAITMGIPFEKVSEFSNTELMSWFIKNYHNPRDKERLKEYDHWFLCLIVNKGYAPSSEAHGYLFHPFFRFAEQEEEIDPMEVKKLEKKAKVKKEKPEKKGRVIDENTGVIKGTKKSLTFELAQKGLDTKAIIAKVKDQFPDANDNSIKIWIKRATTK